MRRWSFTKGHGTENDFVVLLDRESMLEVGPAEVRFICDRRAGIGADGLLRASGSSLASCLSKTWPVDRPSISLPGVGVERRRYYPMAGFGFRWVPRQSEIAGWLSLLLTELTSRR